MDHSQVEFLAEDELIEVRLKFSQPASTNSSRMAKFELICGNFGPIQAGNVITVPLWVAVKLKGSGKCTIIPPIWMTPEFLEDLKSQEINSPIFTELPSKFLVNIVHLLLAYAPDDVPHGDEIKTLVKDIMDHREAKLRSSIESLMKAETSHAKLNHLTPLEISRIRPFLVGAMDLLAKLEAAAHDVDPNVSRILSQSQSQ